MSTAISAPLTAVEEYEVPIPIMDEFSCLISDRDEDSDQPSTNQDLLDRIQVLEAQMSVCLQPQAQPQSLLHEVLDKCKALEERVNALQEVVDAQLIKEGQFTHSNLSQSGQDQEYGAREPEVESIEVVLDPFSPVSSPSPSLSSSVTSIPDGPQNHRCKICPILADQNIHDFEFESLEELANHYTSQHPIFPFSCKEEIEEIEDPELSLPEESSSSQSDLHASRRKIRLRQSEPSASSRTPAMKKSASASKGRNSDGPLVCDICDKTLASQWGLRAHKENFHSKKGRLPCSVCGKQVYRGSMMVHMKSHLAKADKANICEICGSKFATITELNNHRRVHTGERPFDCPHCEKRFTDRSTRNRHVLRHEGGPKPFACDECGWTFVAAYELRKHKKRHSKKGLLQRKPRIN